MRIGTFHPGPVTLLQFLSMLSYSITGFQALSLVSGCIQTSIHLEIFVCYFFSKKFNTLIVVYVVGIK